MICTSQLWLEFTGQKPNYITEVMYRINCTFLKRLIILAEICAIVKGKTCKNRFFYEEFEYEGVPSWWG